MKDIQQIFNKSHQYASFTGNEESGVFHFLSSRSRRLKMKFIYMPTVDSSSNVSKYTFNADPVRLLKKSKDLLLLILSDIRD